MSSKTRPRTKLQSGPFRPSYQIVKSQQQQVGGFALAPLIAGATAAYAGLTKYQPFSKANRALEDNIPESKKGNLAYKIAHTVTGVGKSLGIGASIQPMYQGYPVATGTQYQPTPKLKKHRKRKNKK